MNISATVAFFGLLYLTSPFALWGSSDLPEMDRDLNAIRDCLVITGAEKVGVCHLTKVAADDQISETVVAFLSPVEIAFLQYDSRKSLTEPRHLKWGTIQIKGKEFRFDGKDNTWKFVARSSNSNLPLISIPVVSGLFHETEGNLGNTIKGTKALLNKFVKEDASNPMIEALSDVVLSRTLDPKQESQILTFSHDNDIYSYKIEKNGFISFKSITRNKREISRQENRLVERGQLGTALGVPLDELLDRSKADSTELVASESPESSVLRKKAIGIRFAKVGDVLLIKEVFPGSPAEAAGLNTGDKIIDINGSLVRRLEKPDLTQVFTTANRFIMTVEDEFGRRRTLTCDK